MIYQAYSAQESVLDFLRPLASSAGKALCNPWPFVRPGWPARKLAGMLETFADLAVTHVRPAFGINSVTVDDCSVPVTEKIAFSTPFAALLHFKKETGKMGPRVLLVAPMSGHFSTLLRATVKTMLVAHDVYITDWRNARDVPLGDGRFDFSSFVDHVIEFLQVMGPGSHVVAVCQPCVPVLAAAALMAQDKDKAQPRSMTLMAGPIDSRVNPTEVNRLATSRPIEWFEHNLIGIVPLCYAGAMRRVYPGFVQLAAFMSMNLDRHIRAQIDLFCHLANGEDEKAAAIRAFYDEYCAVMDLPAEFYLQTVRIVFQEHNLALGRLEWRGRRVDPRAIRRTALFSVEGGRDDICAVGQTSAAQELCSGLRPYMKRHHVQSDVGHYGVFNGRRWSSYIYPILRSIVYASD